jgi:hypothetical protein
MKRVRVGVRVWVRVRVRVRVRVGHAHLWQEERPRVRVRVRVSLVDFGLLVRLTFLRLLMRRRKKVEPKSSPKSTRLRPKTKQG